MNNSKYVLFLFLVLFKIYVISANENEAEYKKAINLSEVVKTESRFVEKIDAINAVDYPIGLVAEGKGIEYSIIIDKDEINEKGSFLSAYMVFVIPQSGDTLGFAAHMIPLDADGGITGDVKLSLIKPISFKLGSDILITILGGNDGSYALFGCNGFKSMTISANIDFSSETFLCEDTKTGEPILGKKLTTNFKTTIEDWNNMIISVSLPPFQIKGIEGFGFEASNITFDLSDYSNPAGAVLPLKYSEKLPGGNLNLWQGFYLKDLIIRFPPAFSKSDNNSNGNNSVRTSIFASNLIIDDEGFSGTIGADGVLKIEEGSMSGWNFSIDRFDMTFEMSSITSSSFRGKMKIPMLDSLLLYRAVIGMDGNFSFTITTTTKQSFSLWAADLELTNSQITIDYINKKFKPKAILNGKLNISADLSGSKKSNDGEKSLSLAEIKFENLELQTETPYIKGGYFSLGSEKATQKMANFPLQIDSLSVLFDNNYAKLTIGVKVSVLGGEEGGGLNVKGVVNINGEHIKNQNSDYWAYKNVDIGELTIKSNLSVFKFEGSLLFFRDDQVYGKGFQGNITANIGIGEQGIKVSANAIFGKVSSYNYWYFDILASFSVGIPILPGVGIYGIGGGVYYHVQQSGISNSGKTTLGVTNSGLVYKPNNNVFLGLKTTVVIGTMPNKEVFNGDVTFEIAFNRNFGIKEISFIGNGYFLTPPLEANQEALKLNAKSIANAGKVNDGPSDSKRASIKANVKISYDFTNDVLTGNLQVFVNVGGVIKGGGPNNLAGDAQLYFSKDDWYIYIGKPGSEVGINMFNIFSTRSYFMMGTKIEGSPNPPEDVTKNISSYDIANYMSELNSIENCSGVAFGSRLDISTGDVTYLMFYGNLSAGVGFDVALKNYGDIRCKGSSDVIGINGWYANGQAWAYLSGKIGIRVKIFKIEKKATIFDTQIGAIMQGQMPNPFYLQGSISGSFNVLGGLAKGKYEFCFKIGEKCEIEGGSPLNNISVIAKLTPVDNDNDVNVFTSPQAVFNYAIEEPFELVDLDNKKKTFRIKLEYFNIYYDSKILEASYKWSDDKKTLALSTKDILPAEKTLKLKVVVSFEEKVNGDWQQVKDNGSPLIETLETTFKTGKEPDNIDYSYVEYSYPIINQLNYYKNETSECYIKLTKGFDDLFNDIDEFYNKGRFVDLSTGLSYEFDVIYNFSNDIITFTRPNDLPNGKILKLELFKRPKSVQARIDANVKQISNVVEKTENTNVEVTTRTAEGTIKNAQDKIIFSMYFRTSEYNTVKDKFMNIDGKIGYINGILTNVALMETRFEINEGFDKYELNGTKDIKPLIKIEADLTNNSWYNENSYLTVYKDYPITPLLTLEDPYGLPPIKAVFLRQDYEDVILTQSDIERNSFDYTKVNKKVIIYDLAYYMYLDQNNLVNKIVHYYWDRLTDKMKVPFNNRIKYYYKQYYYLSIIYNIPGKSDPISRSLIKIYNNIDMR